MNYGKVSSVNSRASSVNYRVNHSVNTVNAVNSVNSVNHKVASADPRQWASLRASGPPHLD